MALQQRRHAAVSASLLLLFLPLSSAFVTPATPGRCMAFQPEAPFLSSSTSTISSSSSSPATLYMAKRRGKLGEIVSAGEEVSTTPRKKKKKMLDRKSTKTKSTPTIKKSSTISPLLAEWASSSDSTTTDATTENTVVEENDAASTFLPFDDDEEEASSKPKKRRSSSSTKSVKQQQDEEQTAFVQARIQTIASILDPEDKSNAPSDTLTAILNELRPLAESPVAPNLRPIIAATARSNYRLAWVGSDDALCHVGTGLHKVPLARMQEVFFNCAGKSRLEVLEVIRVIGPFPNVRNTLEGSMKLGKRKDSDTVVDLAITYDSMIDGTGKTIAAGTADNIRKVQLQIVYGDANAILAVVPPEDGSVRADALEDNGTHVLFFVKEDELDEKLNALRVL